MMTEVGGVYLCQSDDDTCDVDGCGNENCMTVKLDEGEFKICGRHLTILIGRIGQRSELLETGEQR
jgi:hypothetical protein